MKRMYTLLIGSLLCLSVVSYGQVVPKGMKYQAIARNSVGAVLANEKISLRIALVNGNQKDVYYTEVHDVATNQLGLFDLVIGEGKVEKGAFASVPWSQEDIWMQVSMKGSQGGAFVTISSSKLLAVPYALHALTASQVVGSRGNSPFAITQTLGSTSTGSSAPGGAWLLGGNLKSNPASDKIGTVDLVDLVVVTNNVQRMRVFREGNILMNRSLNIGENLDVTGNVRLNNGVGNTINFGNFQVGTQARQSSTLLAGTLTVDLATDLNSTLNVDGGTNLNSFLNVNNGSPTKLTGSLNVDGITDLNNNLNVNNEKPTLLTGTLEGRKDVLFKEKVLLDNAYHNSESTTTGALVVNGGFGLGKNLNVGGDANFGGKTTFAGAVAITDETESESTSTGALKVTGGVGVGKRLNVGGAAALGGTLDVTGATSLNNTLTVAEATTLNKTLTVGGATTFNNTLQVTNSGGLDGGYVAEFNNTNSTNGIAIKVGAPTPANANNFITFRNSGGNTVGRIEGETVPELESNKDYQAQLLTLDLDIAASVIDQTIAIAEIVQAGIELAAAASSSTACVGLGACVTAPIPSLIVSEGANLILAIATAASEALSLANAVQTRVQFVNSKVSQIGVTYQSGSGDYAEWLPKASKMERFLPGYIVGIKDGQVTLNTEDASKLMVVSNKPIVLGNMPAAGKESDFEKIAFMGQVPVHVIGKVKRGDYILPSGRNNGLGIAVSPDKMKAEDYARIVGVAWSDSENNTYNQINVAVGLNSGDVTRVVIEQNKKLAQQSEELSLMRKQMAENDAILAKLIPGYKAAKGLSDAEVSAPVVAHSTKQNGNGKLIASADDIVYFELEPGQLDAMFEMAEKSFIESGGKMEDHPFWKKMKTDPSFKAQVKQQVAGKFKNAVHTHKELNEKHLKHKG